MSAMNGDLASWLRSLSVDELAALLRLRPDALAAPVPGSLDDLAHRLSSQRSVQAALRQLSAPALAVSELLQALSGDATREEFSRRLAVEDPVDAATVELAVR